MTKLTRLLGLTTAVAGMAMIGHAASAEEGMWTFDNFPAVKMRSEYGWAPDQPWLDHVRQSAVRLTGGCSASFVSPEGLILTNHHCVIDCLQNLSTAQNDLVAGGFNPATRAEERRCPGQQAEVVTSITDVTARVRGAITSLTGEALVRRRDAEIAAIESGEGCTDRAKNRCQVVTLFGGGQYKLYRYRKYSDVRIAWAPEFQAAFFGGDPDNFSFPRYALDASFLRAYEDGRPVAVSSFLRWNPRAPQLGEVTFVAGNPGTTRRAITEVERAYQRELRLPITLILASELRGRILGATEGNADRTREAADTLFGIENSFKAQSGQLRALNDPEFRGNLTASEADLRRRAAGRAGLDEAYRSIDQAVAANRELYYEARFLAGPQANTLYSYAQTLVRAAEERGKPNADRLPEYGDSRLPLLEEQVLGPVPVYPWLEKLTMAFWLSKTREYLTADHPDVRRLLGRESPEALAERLISGTRLADPAERRRLWEGGAAAIAASNDPLIMFARANDARAREVRRALEARVTGPLAAAQSALADARFAAYGDTLYPDATFTLRLSYGKVQGWTENGREIPYATRMGGTFDRATGQQPFLLARGYEASRSRIDPNAVYDFVTTNDIIGGNSGSPVIARDGSVIGAAFDGNLGSLGGDYGYDGRVNRTVVVSTQAIQEALTKIYPAPGLVRELGSTPTAPRRSR